MTLRDLLSHFKDETTWVDLCTPLRRFAGEIRELNRALPDRLLDTSVSNWQYDTILEVDM